jgi:hypothetical protein
VLNSKYVLNVVDPKLTKDHSVSLNSRDLIAHTTYHFQVKSVDGTGNLAFSKDLTFKTEPTNAKSKYGNFWAAFAVIIIIAAAAYVGSGYIRRMKSQALTTTGPLLNTPSGRQSGGTVVKPDSSTTDQASIEAKSTITPEAKPINMPKDNSPKNDPPNLTPSK